MPPTNTFPSPPATLPFRHRPPAEQKSRNATCDTPLVTFMTQLLECCRRDATPLYKSLVNANLKVRPLGLL